MRKHIIVVGAGIIGASIAYYLAKAGAKVTVLEKNQIAAEASGSSFGWLNANAPESADYFALRNASLDEYPRLLKQLAVNVEAQFSGCLFWEMQGEALIENYQNLKLLDYPVELVDSGTFSKLEPNMQNIPSLALYAQVEGAVDSEKLTRALLHQSTATVIEQCEVSALQLTDNQVVGVRTPRGVFSADTVVIAAGISTQKLLEQVDMNLPMHNRKGFIVNTKPIERIISRVMFGDDIHFKQHDNGAIVIGDWLHDVDGDIELEDTAQLTFDRFSRYFPSLEKLEIDKITCAYRPMPQDGYSAIGASKQLKGLYSATTHSGVTLAPIIGKLAVKEIMSERKLSLLNPFRLERFD